MTPPLSEGDFVWAEFPVRENPTSPGALHISYIVAVFDTGAGYDAVAAYTTSQPWSEENRPIGVFAFTEMKAKALEQIKPFVLDLRRLAFVPVANEWFPRLGRAGNGVVGKAPMSLHRQIRQVVEDLLTRRSELIERLGPGWPSPPRR